MQVLKCQVEGRTNGDTKGNHGNKVPTLKEDTKKVTEKKEKETEKIYL